MLAHEKLRRVPASLKDRIFALADDPYDRRWFIDVFGALPIFVMKACVAEWETRYRSCGRAAATEYALMLREDVVPVLSDAHALPADASASDVKDEADKAAREARERIRLHQSDAEARVNALRRLCENYGVHPPRVKHVSQVAARLSGPEWWRRSLRNRFRIAEHAAIKAGLVHAHRAPYVSDEALARHEQQGRRIARMMERLEIFNLETGETRALDEVLSFTTANPARRRTGMMVALRGLEELAATRGFSGRFLTITCPSRMHARYQKSGAANPSYDGTRPDRASRYLCRLWNNAIRQLEHRGVRPGVDFFGMRGVEPNHDATPHWHVLVFVRPQFEQVLIDTIRDYAMHDSPDEPGAAERRYVAKACEPGKSAAGYMSKYIGKNIDGAFVGEDTEAGGDASVTVHRVGAWARLWGIRQFQFFGVGTLSPFRELFRLTTGRELPSDPLLRTLCQLAAANEFGAYLATRDASGARLALFYADAESTRYPGETVKRLRGVVLHASDGGRLVAVTRPDQWSIRTKSRQDTEKTRFSRRETPVFDLPWTRINNSASVDSEGVFTVKHGVTPVQGGAAGPPRRKAPRSEHPCPAGAMPVERQRHDTRMPEARP